MLPTTPMFTSPVQTSHLNSRFIYATACLIFTGYLIDILTLVYPKLKAPPQKNLFYPQCKSSPSQLSFNFLPVAQAKNLRVNFSYFFSYPPCNLSEILLTLPSKYIQNQTTSPTFTDLSWSMHHVLLPKLQQYSPN